MEIVQGRIGRAIWPELLHGLLALEPVAGRDCEHLHELARFAQAPGRSRDQLTVDLDVEAAEQANPDR
ncbi:MAG: hypothetical protein WEG56_03645 [Chloroflexota bacterium]